MSLGPDGVLVTLERPEGGAREPWRTSKGSVRAGCFPGLLGLSLAAFRTAGLPRTVRVPHAAAPRTRGGGDGRLYAPAVTACSGPGSCKLLLRFFLLCFLIK